MSYKQQDVVLGDAYEPMKEPRYGEIATFMRAPLATSLADVDIGLIGVPTDLGVTNRPGARHGEDAGARRHRRQIAGQALPVSLQQKIV